MSRCRAVPQALADAMAAEFAAGHRVIAVATRTAVAATALTAADERDLDLVGFLVFLDPPKPDAVTALRRLADLGVTVKVITGDNATVATKLCGDLGLATGAALTGADIDRLDDEALTTAIAATTVFARTTPAQKARIVRVRRRAGGDVAFLGDGVNDALALHAADVGISVDTATDVAKDAADVILLQKDLDVLADGVVEGRRIFANTIKYVLMGTSSNFGNMFSAAGASIVLSFLPMLPSQILLNNLLYDSSQLAIPTDNVDAEQLRRPSHWDIAFIRRFMFYFGPFSSLFDFITFGIMAWGFHAGPGPVPVRLVRGVARHPDADHLRDPHQTSAVFPQPAEPRADFVRPDRGRHRCVAAGFAVVAPVGLPAAAGCVLRGIVRPGARVPGAGRGGKVGVLQGGGPPASAAVAAA